MPIPVDSGGGRGNRTPKPKKRKVRRPKPPSPTRQAAAQEKQYASQGRSVEKQANQQRRAARVRRKARVQAQSERRAQAQERGYKSQGRQVAKAAAKQSKQREIQDRGGKKLPGQIKERAKKELEGRGALAGALDYVSKHAYVSSTGAGPTIAPGTALTRAKKRGKLPGATVTPIDNRTASGRFVQDFITFPAQAIPSVYQPVAGAYEAAKGRPQRIKKVAKDISENDPVYNLGAAGVAATRGRSKKARAHLKNVERAASEHPGLTAIEVVGAKGIVGRSAGRVGRTGVVGKGAKRAASTKRAARAVPHTNIVQQRTYSPDVITKAGQVAVEKSRRRHVRKLRKRAETAPVEQARALRDQAVRLDPDRVPEHEIKRRVDERVAVNEDIRRSNRARVVREAEKIVKPAKREGAATAVVAQRIAKANRSDLQAYVRELEVEFPKLSNAQKRANKDLRRNLQRVIDDPKANLGRVEDVARKYQELTAPLQKKLVSHGLLDKDQAERAALIPYAVRRMGAKHDEQHGIVSKSGEPLSTAAITRHMRANGEDPAAWVTQAPGQRGARNFSVRSERPVKASAGRRTGEATRRGTFDADPATLVEGAARQQGLVDATEGFRALLNETGVRHSKSGKLRVFQTHKQATNAARELVHDENGEPIAGAHALRPVRINPFGGTKQQLDSLLEDVNVEKGVKEAIESAARGEEGAGPWALVPEAVAERLNEHMGRQGGGAGAKGLQLVNQAFRRTVLSTSTSWFAGNFIEGIGRAALERAGPRSYITGRRTLKRLGEISPKAAEEAAHRIIGGGHYALSDRSHVRRGAEQFEGTRVAPLATALGRFWRLPGPKQAANLWNRWTNLVFHDINGRAESQIQMAMLGRALRGSELMDGKLLKTGQAAIDDAAKGLTKTENQVAFGRQVDRMYGKYSKFSPSMRHWLATYTPFMAWALNATYFVYRTLPRDHPVATLVIASSEQATQEWRRDQGLDQFMGKGALPGFLQGSIPMSGGRHSRVSRFTPFGAFGSPSETLAGQVLPLWSGVLAALDGQDWKGKKLRVKNPDGTQRDADEIERFVFAAQAFLDGTIPVVSQAKRVKEQGVKALNPLRPVAPAEKDSGGRLSSGGLITPGRLRVRRPSSSSSSSGAAGLPAPPSPGTGHGGGGSVSGLPAPPPP